MSKAFQVSCWAVLLTLVLGGDGRAQSVAASRIKLPIDDQNRVTLTGNVHPLAQAQYDQGAVEDSFPASRIILMLSRSSEKEAALQQFLQDAHTPGNASYHRWLTPQQIGAAYGPSDAEVGAVTGWLKQHGFAVGRLSPGKTALEFSGTAGEVKQTFHTEIHAYLVNGELHYANNADPQIPAALAPVISGITPMNNFHPQSDLVQAGEGVYKPETHELTPQWTESSNPPVLILGPGDFAVQYDLNPLYNAGQNGAGVTIGVISASNIDPSVAERYHTLFGLPPLNFTAVVDGNDTDPEGGNWATDEAYLDVEVSSSIAPGAMVNLYTAGDTSVQSGLLLAAQRAVDDDQAPVLSLSYGECEADLGTAGNQFWAGLWEQAAAQGQTAFVASGDSGSAGCDNFSAAQPAQDGLAVNGFSSTPWNVSVGGTDFYYSSYNGSASAQLAQIGGYWNLNVTDQPTVSLLQYVPEQPWNEAFGLNLSDGGIYNPNLNGVTIIAGSGGASTLYAKPSWQSGSGVPADKARDLPDVSLFASSGTNDSSWLLCEGEDGCIEFAPGAYGNVYGVGGTSASTPAMAAIMAILDQKYGPQGQADFIFYPLAAQDPADFHDIAIGGNDVPCQQGTPDCTLSTASDNTKGFYTLGHYDATKGYDQATGLGSVDANHLVQSWSSLSFKGSSTALTVSQTSFMHGTPVTVDVTVTGTGGTPSGDVGLVTNASPASNTGVGELTLASGAASGTYDDLPGGKYQLTARYAGDTVFASSSASVSLDVQPEKSTVALTGNYWNSSTNAFAPMVSGASYPYGTYIVLDAEPRGADAPAGQTDGLATGSVTFTDSVGSSSLSSGAVAIDRLGTAEWQPLASLPVGLNSVSAAYPGDPSFEGSSSGAPFVFTIGKAQTVAYGFVEPREIVLGATTTLGITVGVPNSGPGCGSGGCTLASPSLIVPTGSATFSFGSTVLGTVPISSASGSATLNVSTLPLGNDTVTVNYSGDANCGPATASFNVLVEQSATISAVANPSSIDQAESTAITATVAGQSGLPTPTGTITYTNYSLYLPYVNESDWSDTETLSNGTATSKPLLGSLAMTPSALVQVSYSGDSTYAPQSAFLTFPVTSGTTLPFSLSGSALTIAAGASSGNGSTVTVTPLGGFTGGVFLSCALASSPAGAIHLPTCSIPASVEITGTAAATAVMTVSSTAPVTVTGVSPVHGGRGLPWSAANGGVLLCGVLMVGGLGRSRRRGLWMSVALLMVLNGLVACGGGKGGGLTATQQIPGTTPGAYTFTVNGALSANGVSQTQTTVNVTIQ